MPAGRPLKFQDVKAFDDAVAEYFRKAEGKATVTGLALHLDCEVETLKSYSERDAFSASVKRAYLMVQNGYETKLYEPSCTGAIFALKNFGWKDKSEQEVTSNSTVKLDMSKLSDEELRKLAGI